MRCLVLAARRYSFKDSETGALVEGAKLHYLTLDGEQDGDTDQRGEVPFEVSIPLAVYEELREVPAFYDVDFRQRPGRGGRPTLQAVGLSYQGEVSFEEATPAVGT